MSKDFFKQTPIGPSNLKPILPENVDLNKVMSDIVRLKVIDDAASEASRKAWAEEQLALRIKAQREDDAAAREERNRKQWHEENAKTRAEETAGRAVGRQIRFKAKLVELCAACAGAQSLIDSIEDKNAFEIAHFKSTIAVLNNSLNPK